MTHATERSDGEESDEQPQVCCLKATADRSVFTEKGNTDGWIATDLTVDLRP